MARNAEKAMTTLARWRAAQVQEAGGQRERRPFLASECNDLQQAEKWRLQIVREIAKKVAQIQNGYSNYDEIFTKVNANELKIRVPKSTKVDRIAKYNRMQELCTCEETPYNTGDQIQFEMPKDYNYPDKSNNTFTSNLKYTHNGCRHDPKDRKIINVTPTNCPVPVDMQKEIHPQKDVFILKIGKKLETKDKKTDLEIELVTPKVPKDEGNTIGQQCSSNVVKSSKLKNKTRKNKSKTNLKKKKTGLGEFRIRDLNDEINKLMREKRHWEVQIKSLGGPDHARVGPRMLDQDGKEVPGNRGYKYFGAAKDLPAIARAVDEWKRNKEDDLHEDVPEEENIYPEDPDDKRVDEDSDTEKVSHVAVPSQRDIEEALLRKKKQELLEKYGCLDVKMEDS
ncbi:unnamed protein product [Leptidea sinapis]|uniref:Pre-mRNA-splicing factor ISY1 homolog n=1 Tax=Leptidea sinapis TaxID=189913 RepID=A0A5E4Q502_9NEOP|nr:unnamed protein product [Leptidea sinapis]